MVARGARRAREGGGRGSLLHALPRPLLLALTGDSDPTCPPNGTRILEQKLADIYGLYGAGERFLSVVYPGVDHT